MSDCKDIEGQKFNHLTLIRRIKGSEWLCRCDCGKELSVKSRGFARENKPQKSCMECYKKRRILHGMTNTKEFFAWRGILSRCRTVTDEAYSNYGARGITVCDRWLEFKNFFEDMGFAPTKKHSIDRIDNNKGYYKENCRWATQKVQANNTRKTIFIEHNGVKKSLSEWCDELSLRRMGVYLRIHRGMNPLEALTKPFQIRHK